MLFATVSQDIDELGLVCSPFQFPRLIQVLRRKKRGRHNRKNKPRETGETQNNCLILDRAATGDLLTFLPIFLSVEAPTPPSLMNQTSPLLLPKPPLRSVRWLFPSLPFQSSHNFLFLRVCVGCVKGCQGVNLAFCFLEMVHRVCLFFEAVSSTFYMGAGVQIQVTILLQHIL